MDTATIQTWLSIIKDIVTILAAGVAAIVAIMGLQTWKRQLRANTEHDLARRVLIALYKTRDALLHCRLPLGQQVNEKTVMLIKTIHDERLAELSKAEADLDVELLEAEAVWGDEENYRANLGFLTVLSTEMRIECEAYYSDNDDAERKAEAYEVIFSDNADEDYSKTLRKVVNQVEDILRPKLTLKQAKRKKGHWWDRFKKSRL